MVSSRPSLLKVLRSFPAPVWVLFAGTFLNKFGTFVMPFLTLYLTGKGFPTRAAAGALACFGLGHMGASFIGGLLADRIGRRNTILISMFSVAITMLLLSQATSLSAILSMTFLVGFTGELYRPASSALLADLVPPEHRVVAYSAYRLALNAGFAFGPACAGFLAKSDFFWLFFGDSISSLAFGILVLFAFPRTFKRGGGGESTAGFWSVIRQDHSFLTILAATLCVAFVFMQMGSSLGLHVVRSGYSPEFYGGVLSLNGVMVVLLEMTVSSLSQHWSRNRAIAAGFILIGMGFSLALATSHGTFIVVGMIIFTLGEMTSIPLSSAFVADLAPAEMRGRYMGLHSMTWAVAVVIGPALGVLAYDQAPRALWIAAACLPCLAAFLIGRAGKGRNLTTVSMNVS